MRRYEMASPRMGVKVEERKAHPDLWECKVCHVYQFGDKCVECGRARPPKECDAK